MCSSCARADVFPGIPVCPVYRFFLVLPLQAGKPGHRLYQAAAGIEAMGAGYTAACGKCMKRATQMFYNKALKDISRAVVEALVRY